MDRRGRHAVDVFDLLRPRSLDEGERARVQVLKDLQGQPLLGSEPLAGEEALAAIHDLLSYARGHRAHTPVHLLGVGEAPGLGDFVELVQGLRDDPLIKAIADPVGGLKGVYIVLAETESEVMSWWSGLAETRVGALALCRGRDQIILPQDVDEEAGTLIQLLGYEAVDGVDDRLLPPAGELWHVVLFAVEDGLWSAIRARSLEGARGLASRLLHMDFPEGPPADPAHEFASAWVANTPRPADPDTTIHEAAQAYNDHLQRAAVTVERVADQVCREHVQAQMLLDEPWTDRVLGSLQRGLQRELADSAGAGARAVIEPLAQEAQQWEGSLASLHRQGKTEVGLQPLVKLLHSRMDQLNQARARLGPTAGSSPASWAAAASPEAARRRLERARQVASSDMERLPPRGLLGSWFLVPVLLLGMLVVPLLLALGQALGPPDPGAASATFYHIHRYVVDPLVTAPGAALAGLALTWFMYRGALRIASQRIEAQVAEHLMPNLGTLARAIAAAAPCADEIIASEIQTFDDLVHKELQRQLDQYRRVLERSLADLTHTCACADWLHAELGRIRRAIQRPEQGCWTLQRDGTSLTRWILVPPASAFPDKEDEQKDAHQEAYWTDARRPDDAELAQRELLWPDKFLGRYAELAGLDIEPRGQEGDPPAWAEFDGFRQEFPEQMGRSRVATDACVLLGDALSERIRHTARPGSRPTFPPGAHDAYPVIRAHQPDIAYVLHRRYLEHS